MYKQKDIEKQIVIKVLKHYKIKCELESQESPDFITFISNKTIGIEHTKCGKKGKPSISFSADMNKITQNIRKQLSQKEKDFIVILNTPFQPIYTPPYLNKRNNSYEYIEDEIINLVKGNLKCLHINQLKKIPLPPSNPFSEIILQKRTGHTCVGYFGQANYVPIEENLKEAITRKEKCSLSFSKCDEYWLIIEINSFQEKFAYDTTKLPTIKNSTFKRIILFDSATGKIMKLLHI